jgi:hypothetical protein
VVKEGRGIIVSVHSVGPVRTVTLCSMVGKEVAADIDLTVEFTTGGHRDHPAEPCQIFWEEIKGFAGSAH